MGLVKSLIILALLFTPLAPVVIGYLLISYGIKFVIWDAKLMFNAAFLLFIGIPELILWIIFYLFLYQFILKGLFGIGKFSGHWLEWLFGHFTEGIEVIEHNIERAGEFMVFWGIIVIFVFPLEPSLSFFVNNIQTLFTLAAMIFLPIIIGAAALNKIKGGSLTEAKQTAAQKAGQVAGAAPTENARRGAQGVYNQVGSGAAGAAGAVNTGKELNEAADGIKWVPANISKVSMNLAKLLHLAGDKTESKAVESAARAGAKRAGQGATAAAETLEYTSALPYMLVGLVLAVVVLAVQMMLLGGLFIGFVNFWLPLVAGPVMGALGLGEAYGQFLGQSTANTLAPQVDSMFQEEIRAAQQMTARLGCMAKGPQCFRQWQMNNTVRPGSDSRGETYELRIDRFRTSQEKIDVAYKEKGYSLPISFLVYNTRHGLKGINARNVSYRISVEDSSHQGDNAYCSTGWRKIDTGTGNYILPGLGVQPRESMDDLNLSACGLLQPSMGVNRVLAMDLKYEYSSQATLYFDAMSREHRREQQIMPDFKKSKTAKTPVQSYINVNSPVTYYTLENGSRRPVPFPARFGFQTPGFSIKYQVDPQSVEIDDSVYTEHIEDSCRGIEHQGNNDYEMSQRAIDRVESRQRDTWFTNGINPAPLKCTFKLTQSAVDSINPTGSELLMRIDANYTIVRQQQHSTFEMVNTRCSRKNCPLLVTEGYNESHYGNMFSKCDYSTSVDSYGGCSVLVPESNGDINWADPDLAKKNNGQDLVLEQGETAYSLTEFKQNVRDRNIPSTTLWENGSYQPYSNIIGADDEKFEELAGSNSGVSIFEDQGELMMREVRMKLCDENNNKKSQFASAWKDRYGAGNVMMMKIKYTDCRDAYQNMIQAYECEIDFASEIIQQGVGWNTFIEGGGWFGNTQTACHELYDRLQGCGGVLISRNDRVRCVT